MLRILSKYLFTESLLDLLLLATSRNIAAVVGTVFFVWLLPAVESL